MKAIELLKAAREVLSNPEHWTTNGFYACNAEGGSTSSRDPNAVKFCMLGAILKFTDAQDNPNRSYTEYDKAENALARCLPYHQTNVVLFNDNCKSHAEILVVFDRAIRLLEKEQEEK